MINQTQTFQINVAQRNQLYQEIEDLKREKVLLKQAVQEQEEQAQAEKEELYLELLELFDALESLANYSEDNPNPKFFQRLPKSLKSIQKKLLITLGRREVTPINFQDSKADFSICRVVDSEVRDDLEEQTITKVVRQGFKLQDKLLRSMDVITSRKSS